MHPHSDACDVIFVFSARPTFIFVTMSAKQLKTIRLVVWSEIGSEVGPEVRGSFRGSLGDCWEVAGKVEGRPGGRR